MTAAMAWRGAHWRQWWGRSGTDVALIAAVGLIVRLALWPFATTDTADSPLRIWLAWRWLADSSAIRGVPWAPLHFYLMAPLLWLTGDPVVAPIALHIVIGAAAAPLVYGFCLQEFGDRRASLAAALAFALYPVAIRNSLMALSEPPFIFFLALSLLFLSLARGAGGARHHAVLAGLALTLAGMLRYEAWMLIPFCAVLLWRRRDLVLWFLACGLLYPVFQMVSHTWLYGDPLYSMHWSVRWEVGAMARLERNPLGDRIDAALQLGWITIRGMSPPVALLAACGAALALLRRSRQAEWLLPCAGLFALLATSALQGALVPRLFYTETFGLFMIPYLALLLSALPLERWHRPHYVAAVLLVAGGVLVLGLPGVRAAVPPAGLLAGASPIPAFEGQETARRLPALITSHLKDESEGLISDFYGWAPTYYVALLTRLYPDRFVVVSGAPNLPIDMDQLADFLERHPEGVFLLHLGSRLRTAIAFDGERAAVDGHALALTRVADVPWPVFTDPTLRAAEGDAVPDLALFRYRVADDDAVSQRR